MSSTPTKQRSRKKGRAGRLSEIPPFQIDRAREYFDMNQTAEYASKQPDTPGREACQKLFRQWEMELIDGRNLDVDERQQLALEKLKNTYRRLITKAEFQLNIFENLSQQKRKEWSKALGIKGATLPDYKPDMQWEYMIKNLNEYIAQLQDSLISMDIQTTVNEDSEEARLAQLQKQHETQMKKLSTVRKHPPKP